MSHSNYQTEFDANRQLWNKRVAVHSRSPFYNLPGFKSGNCTLTAIERDALGDVAGKSLLHLQCHFGLDTLSLSRKGAHVTGVDFSEAAIAMARTLATEAGLEARFICQNIYDLEQDLDEQFDIVYTSFGTVGWLPDVNEWARLVARYLKPGGAFFIADFHPVCWMFNDAFTEISYSYFNEGAIKEEVDFSYADRNSAVGGTAYGWNHGLGSIVTSLISNNLRISSLSEYSYSPFSNFANTVQGPDGFWRIPHLQNKLPLVYSLQAEKI